MHNRVSTCLSLFPVAAVIIACTTPATTVAPAPTSTGTSTLTPIPPSATPRPLPSPTDTPSGPPTATSQPPIDATEPQHVTGTWLAHWKGDLGKHIVDVKLQFNPDGTFRLVSVKDQIPFGDGTYHFKDGKLYFESTRCLTPRGDLVPCTGIYSVLATFRADVPVLLKFTLVEDRLDPDRAMTLDNAILPAVEPLE